MDTTNGISPIPFMLRNRAAELVGVTLVVALTETFYNNMVVGAICLSIPETPVQAPVLNRL